MVRTVSALMAAAWLAAPVPALAWTEGLFEEKVRDFGTVPRGPLLTHPYRLTNTSNQTLHVGGVRVSCGCTTASVLQDTLAPGATTVVLAQMDTRRFVGPRSVVIYVLVDQPSLFEERLTITANSQDALAVTPEAVSFGAVRKGDPAEAKALVTFRGDPNWQITGASSSSTFVEPAVAEKVRNGAEVTYELTARLKPGVPVGRWYTDLWLVTTNPTTPRVHVPVALEVRAALTLVPGPAQFGRVPVGQTAERNVMVQGTRPFRVLEIKGGDGVVSAAPGMATANTVQVITVKLRPAGAGTIDRTLKVVTDLPDENVIDLPAQAQAGP